METPANKKLMELQSIISRMPLDVCCVAVLPELGLRWCDVSKAIRNSRLPMLPASVARVLCQHVAKSLTLDEVEDIVSRLRLKSVATQDRKWHVISLSEPTNDMSVAHMIRALPSKVAQELKRTRGGRSLRRPEVQTVLLGDLLYMSVQMVSESKEGAVFYLATPPGEPVALVSSLTSSLLKGCVLALGYNAYTDAKLFGHDIKSLLRIHDGGWNCATNLGGMPEYNPVPVVTASGVDFTNKTYNERYIDDVIGPDAPHLTELQISTSRPFFDRSRLSKSISMSLRVRSADVSRALREWVSRGALAHHSSLFHALANLTTNRIQMDD